MMKALAPLLAVALAGCAASSATEPSLAQRPAEMIDPRLPIESNPPPGPADTALVARLSALVGAGKAGARTFDAQSGQAEVLANAAGPPRSESWIVAQQALSGLESARAASTRALSDVDALAAERIAGGAGLSPADLMAVEAAAAELRAITDRQTAMIDRLGARLGR